MGYIISREAKEGSQRYYIRYKAPNGKWKQEGAGRLKRDATALLARRNTEIADGSYGRESDVTFAEFTWKWQEDHAALKKASTADDYCATVRNHLVPFFGKKQIKAITPHDVQRFVTGQIKKGHSPGTVNKTIMVLKMMFKHAIIWGFLRENPAQYVERPIEGHREMDFLNPQEVGRLLEAANPDYYALFATAVMTGAREGELLALQWGDFDPKMRVLYIRRSYSPKHGISSTKSWAGNRAVNLAPQNIDILKEHHERVGGGPDDLIFSKDGNPIMAQNMIRDEFLPTLKSAGIRHIRFHCLRHTFAASMIATGENINFIKSQMGHTSIRTTMDLYGHLLPQVSEGTGERLGALFFADNVVHFPAAKSKDA